MQISDFYVDTFIRLNATCIGTHTLSDAFPLTFDGKEYTFERLCAHELRMFCKSQFLSISQLCCAFVWQIAHTMWYDVMETEMPKERMKICDNQRVCMCAFWQCKIWYQHSYERVLVQPFYKINMEWGIWKGAREKCQYNACLYILPHRRSVATDAHNRLCMETSFSKCGRPLMWAIVRIVDDC